MSVPINITSRERVYINPFTGAKLPGLTKGILPPSDMGDGGEEKEAGTADAEANETQE